MKKFLYSLAAILMVAATAFMFTACGNDDDEPEKEKTVKEVKLKLGIGVNKAIVDAFDITGKVLGQELTISKTPEEVSFEGKKATLYTMFISGDSNSLPFMGALKVSYKLKDGYQVPEKEDYRIVALASGEVIYSDGSSVQVPSKGVDVTSKGMPAANIDKYEEYLNSNFNYIKAVFEENGHIELTTNAE